MSCVNNLLSELNKAKNKNELWKAVDKIWIHYNLPPNFGDEGLGLEIEELNECEKPNIELIKSLITVHIKISEIYNNQPEELKHYYDNEFVLNIAK